MQREELKTVCNSFGYELAAVQSVISVETSGVGFDKATGKIIIRFEPAVFHTYTGKLITKTLPLQQGEWFAFNEAWKINQEDTMLSTSFGLGQVMGFNYKLAGFNSVGEMIDYFKVSELNQVHGMLSFIKSNSHLDTAIKNKDWSTFAYHYNGSGYKVNQYDTKLAQFYAQHIKEN